ncbi:MAG TPA: Gfo/Idh/MocA family oxidoreductase [Longimicrobiaceae bacterium]|nr:Gfo/Idh/MocA family oxidoreductase [Longimicrobiaceae bacterium]
MAWKGDRSVGVIRWGLVGAGDIAEKRVGPALASAPRSALAAVSRRDAGRAGEFARRFGAPRWYASWEELLRDGGIDAVYVATPVHLHAPVSIAAAAAGKHVLCEKPMALALAECDAMIRAAAENDVKLGIAYYRHFYPIVRRVKKLLAEGAIGTPVVARIDAFERFDPAPGHPRAWLLDAARSGGGPMFDFGCHRIEVLQNLFGAVRTVRSELATVALTREVEDTAAALLHFESGPVATLTVTHAAAEPRDTLDIFGTEGSIHVPKLNGAELRIVRGGDARVEEHPPHENLHQPLIEQFIDAVLDGGEPVVDGRAGREVNRVLGEIYG